MRPTAIEWLGRTTSGSIAPWRTPPATFAAVYQSSLVEGQVPLGGDQESPAEALDS